LSQTYFNHNAGIWDVTAAEQDPSKLAVLVDRLELKPGSAILDVGTGTGILLPFLLAAVGAKGQIFGLDYAELMLKQARGKHNTGNITYLLADVDHLPVGPVNFEAVVCYSSFPHFQDKPHALSEIHRTLKPGGRLFICHTSGREHINHIHRGIPSVKNDLLPDNEEMQRMLLAAGFSNIRIEDGRNSYLAVAERSDF
jgi:ubiquinone/menaquinone biosynthesis C-methylase UbiE